MALIDKIKEELIKMGYDAKNRAAIDWLIAKMRNLGSDATKAKVLRDRNRSVEQNSLGRLYFFAYSPKTKDKLPYYDMFPLVFPIEEYDDGFLGLNLHYLSLRDRATLLNQLSSYKNNNRWDHTTKLKMSYQTLQAASRLDIAKPCIKRYLYSNVRSKFIEVTADEWDIAIFLPVDNFVGASRQKVHRDSRNQI